MGTYSGDSPFTEGQIMLAAGAGDEEELERLVHGLLDGELDAMDDAIDAIANALGRERRRRRLELE
jgi:hypothetical protein